MFTDYTEIELNAIITNQVEENIHLDYKGSDSLQKTDNRKREISKDVSSFANSDGGIIIYGILEYNDAPRRHLPERIDAIDRTLISKEWLEQVINSNIQPKISSLRITPIQLSSNVNHVVYVVTIPKSTTAHQSLDKRYYKRYNFESVMMEDYEVKDIINRQSVPVLQFLINSAATTFVDNVITMPLTIRNTSLKMARDVKLTVQINNHQNCEIITTTTLNDLSIANPGRRLYGTMLDSNIYKDLDLQVGSISYRFINATTPISFTIKIYADNMNSLIFNYQMQLVDGQVQYLLE